MVIGASPQLIYFRGCPLRGSAYSAAAGSAGASAGAGNSAAAGASVVVAGVGYSVPAIAGTSCTGFTRAAPCTMSRGITNTLSTDSTSITPASVHVAFSMKSLVRRTPIIWFEPAKAELRPPPFDFCTSTTMIRRMETKTVSPIINEYILFVFCYFSLLIGVLRITLRTFRVRLYEHQLPQEAHLDCKVTAFF